VDVATIFWRLELIEGCCLCSGFVMVGHTGGVFDFIKRVKTVDTVFKLLTKTLHPMVATLIRDVVAL
jgi:hypothetical protein